MCTFSMEHILSNALMNIIKCGFGFARIQIKGAGTPEVITPPLTPTLN